MPPIEMRSLSRSARSPDLPTAMTMRPQLASSPAIAVLTSGELATDSPILRAAPLDEAPVAAHLKGREIVVEVDLGLGDGRATVWTCDLTHGYIDINGSYRS